MASMPVMPILAARPGDLLSPFLILVLCIIAGIGTVMLLPGRREVAIRRLGGAILVAVGLIFLAVLPMRIYGAGFMDRVYFYTFAAIALVGAIRVVTHPKPVYSALYFVLTVFASAGLFVLLEAEFMAAALILIYAGAILVTYVFVIMLASQSSSGDAPTPAQQLAEYDNVSREPLAAATIGFALMGVLLFVIFDRGVELAGPHGAINTVAPSAQPAVSANAVVVSGGTQELGMYLFRNQFIQLELAGLMLTIAMVGAIIIARRNVVLSEEEQAALAKLKPETTVGPATPVDDNPHSIPVYGTRNPRQKAYPQT